MKYCLPLKLPIFFKVVEHLVPVREVGHVDLFYSTPRSRLRAVANPGIRMNNIGLAAGFDLAVDIGIGRPDLEVYFDIGILPSKLSF